MKIKTLNCIKRAIVKIGHYARSNGGPQNPQTLMLHHVTDYKFRKHYNNSNHSNESLRVQKESDEGDMSGKVDGGAELPIRYDGKSLIQIGKEAASAAERRELSEVLDYFHWNRVQAARLVDISYKALLYKIDQCGLGNG